MIRGYPAFLQMLSAAARANSDTVSSAVSTLEDAKSKVADPFFV
jgi:hypothetical protein